MMIRTTTEEILETKLSGWKLVSKVYRVMCVVIFLVITALAMYGHWMLQVCHSQCIGKDFNASRTSYNEGCVCGKTTWENK